MDKLLDMAEVTTIAENLSDESESLLEEVVESSKLSEVALKWFTTISKDYLEEAEGRIPSVDEVEVANTDNLFKGSVSSSGLSQEDIQAIIDGLLEIEMADSTGQFDYASIGNGASIIRSGIRKTSPSIVDNLPLVNQFLSKTSLKFYGHGAEAALVPTFPKTALGQCWSFEEEGSRKQLTIKEMRNEKELESMEYETSRGEYATLTVRLADRIHVNSVIIEHPSKILSPTSMESAIRTFRLIGYIDPDAKGNPWHLGSFIYQTGKYFFESTFHIFHISF